MDLTFSTPLKGNLVLCSDYRDAALHRSPGLYKFVWVRRGCLWLEVDHIPMELRAGMLLPLTPLHTLDVTRADGEVSCSGLLFNGSSEVLRLELSEMRTAALQRVVDDLRAEYGVVDGLREEMLRMQLKRFIIICTRIAREHFSVGADREKLFDTVRRYYVLVDEHFRTKKRVQDYAGLLHRSPKTLANLFASCGQPSPLNIIHDRVNAEARRLLLYTPKSAKEIAYLLGYEDTAAFSRFFAKMNGESITGFRQREKRE